VIKTITLNNWKSFRDAVLHIDPLTVLIGANASGKSNALDALAFLNRVSSGLSITSVLNGDANISGIRGGLEWAPRKPESRFTLGCSVAQVRRVVQSITIKLRLRLRAGLR